MNKMLSFLNLFCLSFIFLIKLTSCRSFDYWSDEFDVGRNCEKPAEIQILLSEKQCKVEHIKGETDARAFSLCKTHLTPILQKKCEYSKIKNAGELLYCKQRGVVTCCFANESCDSWPSLQNKIYTNAREYLTNKMDFLNKLVKSMGYKTCHHLNSLDASQCADDCKELENEKFAKTCKSKGGLFKCCIRRDKRSCHECRYCCTLPMCTMPPGGKEYTEFDGLEELKLESHKNVLRANDLFFSTEHIYKDDDYHCLKPNSHKKKEKWRKYDMDKYREAYSPETLESVPTFKYDNKLYNFVDPEVFESFTKNERIGRKNWRKTYGFYYTKQIPGFYAGKYNETLVAYKCLKKCIKMENSKFARQCRNDGGYFKCCGSYWWLDMFEEARNRLIKDGLIEAKTSQICDSKSQKNPCLYCSMNAICTKSNLFTGGLTHVYYPRTIPEGEWDAPTIGLRSNWCLVLDLCKYHLKSRRYYEKILFQEAKSKEEVCEAAAKGNSDVKTKDEIKVSRGEVEEYLAGDVCKRLYSENFFLCSNGQEKNIVDKKMLSLSKRLERRIKESRQKSSKKKNKRRKKIKLSKKKKSKKKRRSKM